jgi:pullulanase
MEPGNGITICVHYYRYDEQYDGWRLWAWTDGEPGIDRPFDGTDGFGRIATLTVKPGTRRIGLLLRRRSDVADWAERDGGERYADVEALPAQDDGNGERRAIWLIQGRADWFADPAQAQGALREADAEMTDLHGIRIATGVPLKPDRDYGWRLLAGEQPATSTATAGIAVEALNADRHGYATEFRCRSEQPLDPHVPYTLVHEQRGIRAAVRLGGVFDCPLFHERYTYRGDDLGCTYAPEETRFRLWAPTAAEAFVVLYDTWDAPSGRALPMERGEQGTWTLTVPRDLHGTYYTYRVRVLGEWAEAADPYARAVSVNGDRAAVIDLKRSDPEGWQADARPPLLHATDAIIYEVHVRDFSIHPESGMRHKGLFLALTEADTAMPDGTPTGLRHIRELGVTHVQLLPIFDFSSIDERERYHPPYSWGYDPKNYNVPDGAYSTDPYDPLARIRELKQAVLALHRNGLRVIMDVVYNHVHDVNMSHLGKLVPSYYFRMTGANQYANGSGVGNDTASERPMMRKLMTDSVVYWAREYHIDGFRFDLMGIHDVETMQAIREALDAVDPSIVIIGEGWNLNTPLPEERKAMQRNAGRMRGIGHFNDAMRDGLRGSAFDPRAAGFIGGNHALIDQVKGGVAGGIRYSDTIGHFAVEPYHNVNYAEAHDNHTLWDKLQLTNPDVSEDERMRMHKLAAAVILTSQGIPFLHAGQEFLRTKQGEENSYRSPDAINRLDWPRCARYRSVVDAVKGWIRLRREHPALRLPDAERIRRHLRFLDAPPGVLAYALVDHAGGDAWHTIVLLHNTARSDQTVNLPFAGRWRVVCDRDRTGTDTLYELEGGAVSVPALTSMALCFPGS